MKPATPPKSGAWPLLVRLFFAQRANLPPLAAELQLSPAQCHVLHLIEPERPIPMGQLAETLACDASNVTGLVDPPLPNTPAKQLLVTVAWLDKQVSNQATEILVRSLGVPNLTSSVQQGFAEIPDMVPPLDSALVVYDTGSYDIFNPLHYQVVGSGPLIPPLANRIPSGTCDPHAARLTIPASLDQLAAFLRPGGRVENFCDGLCDASIPYERPGGAATSCNPLN